jgi:hypothetical protein
MNATPNPTSRTLSTLTLALAIATALGGCRGQETPTATATDPAPPPAAPAGPPSHDLRPSTGAVEATDANVIAAKQSIETAADSARRRWLGKSFEEFEASVFKEPGERGKYIVNGDIAIPDRKLLREFFDKMQKEADGVANGKLTVGRALTAATTNGGVDIWTSAKKKQLTYCIGNGFGARKAAVLADMGAAARAWEEAANVDFIHVPAQDGNCTATNPNVVFDVNPVDVGGQYFARAFFPSDARGDRNVLIDDSSFELDPNEPLQLVGILRHELGHALGLRHEHTRPEAGTCFEDSDVVVVTAYDKFSVMHYPQCNGGGDWSLMLTGLDKAGSACLYGKGSNNPENLGQCLFSAPDAPVAGTQETRVFDNQSVARNAKKHYGPFAAKRGSLASVVMTGTGAASGDPDLYVRYARKPETTATGWNCRPYLSHANETCELEVPATRDQIFVMVHGYAAGSYKLEVKYVKP